MCWFFIREMLRCKIIGLQKPWQTRIHTGHPASHQWAHACVFDLGAAHSASLQAFQDAIRIHVSLSTKTPHQTSKSTFKSFTTNFFATFFFFLLFPLVSSEGPVWLQFRSCRRPWSTTRQWGSGAKTSGLAFAWWWWRRHWWCITFSVTTLPPANWGFSGLFWLEKNRVMFFFKTKNLEVGKISMIFFVHRPRCNPEIAVRCPILFARQQLGVRKSLRWL